MKDSPSSEIAPNPLKRGFNIRFIYVLRAETYRAYLFPKGMESVAWLARIPMLPLIDIFSGIVSGDFTSSTDDNRPPYCDSIPFFCNCRYEMWPVLKIEKKPNKWEGWYTGASLNKTRFCPDSPPRTNSPEFPVPAVCTPGVNCSIFKGSQLPKNWGRFCRRCMFRVMFPPDNPSMAFSRRAVTTNSLRLYEIGAIYRVRVVSWLITVEW